MPAAVFMGQARHERAGDGQKANDVREVLVLTRTMAQSAEQATDRWVADSAKLHEESRF